MRIPLSWLAEYTQLPESATAEEVMADLVRVGLEEEAVHRPLDELSGPLVVGEVLSIEPEKHSNGKVINWCQVRVAEEGQALSGEGISPDGVQGIICGAHNFSVGDKVAVTLPGAVLPGNFVISTRKTYGHISAGMIASARELGLSDEHEGIIVLSEYGIDAPVGTDLIPLLGLADQAAEIAITPDRGYALSMRGVAREYGLATGTESIDPAAAVQAPAANSNGYPVVLADEAPIRGQTGCDRFVALRVSDINPQLPTPQWMASRLRLAGIRSINLTVDISNYVMLELGQPLHFYDADKLQGAITVRRAAAGEKLTTLDGKERELHREDLLITDESGPLGIAGVMGGASTEVSSETRTVLIESAHFDPVSIGRSRRRHKLPSEAAKRNERGVDPAITAVAAQRAAELLVELAGGSIDSGVTDVDETPAPTTIFLAAKQPENITGVAYSEEQICQAITGFGGQWEKVPARGEQAEGFQVQVPSWRPDMRYDVDVVEEIARLNGYELIPATLPVAPPGKGLTRTQRQRRQLASGFAAAGLTEVLNYPFVSAAENELFAGATPATAEQNIGLLNPIAQQAKFMRQSLLPGLLTATARNVGRGLRDVALYELGSVFIAAEALGSTSLPAAATRPSAAELAELVKAVPQQPQHIAAVLCGHSHRPAAGADNRLWDYADAIDVARLAAHLVGVEVQISQGSHQAFHPGRCAQIHTAAGQLLGYAGELHPEVLASADLPERTVAMELSVDALLAAAEPTIHAHGLSTYPAATQDVALVVDRQLPAATLAATLAEGAGPLLEDLWLFDSYTGSGIEQEKKSLAFGMRFRAPDRTLTAEEVSAQRQAAVELAAARHQASQRS